MKNSDFIEDVLQILMSNEKNQNVVYRILNEKLQELGIVEFIEQIAQPLTTSVGEKWFDSSIDIFVEHLYTQQMNAVLNNWIADYLSKENTNCPRMLLTTLSGEKHSLGLAMVQAILCTQNVFCINLGTELPISEFDKVIQRHKINIVGLSFSVFFPKRIMVAGINQLRAMLPPEVELWVGGDGVKNVQELSPDVKKLFSPHEILLALNQFTQTHR